jgi:methylmalonyl-CoA/ethylmalonyl-CoA epimerase
LIVRQSSEGQPVDQFEKPGAEWGLVQPASAARYVDQVGILVRDADLALRESWASLGLTVVPDEIATEVGVRLVYLAGSDDWHPAAIQLVQPVRSGPMQDQLDALGEGLHHVCLAVADLDTMLDRSDERDNVTFTGGYGRRCSFLVARPSGTLVELIEVPRTRAKQIRPPGSSLPNRSPRR